MNHVFFHRDTDGFASAWSAWQRPEMKDASYESFQHGEPFPLPEPARKNGKVFILDFCPSLETIQTLASQQAYVVIIDHHVSASETIKEARKLPNVHTVFNTEHAGCTLSWRYFNPEEPVPQILKYVEDRDLWAWRLEDSKAINLSLFIEEQTFMNWDKLGTASLSGLVLKGKHMQEYVDSRVKSICSRAVLTMDGVPIVGTTEHCSEVGHLLCKQYPNSPYSVTFHDQLDGTRIYELRSIGEYDVSVLAKRHGGGGHKNAAGFSSKQGEYVY